MITREQVADLRPGDVVEVVRRERFTIDEVTPDGRAYPWIGDGEDTDIESMTVMYRAPRPLYVNHERTEPVPGDVVRFQSDDHPNDAYTDVYLPRSEHDPQPWVSLTDDFGTRYSDEDARADHLDGWTTRLLVDGETGRCVP